MKDAEWILLLIMCTVAICKIWEPQPKIDPLFPSKAIPGTVKSAGIFREWKGPCNPKLAQFRFIPLTFDFFSKIFCLHIRSCSECKVGTRGNEAFHLIDQLIVHYLHLLGIQDLSYHIHNDCNQFFFTIWEVFLFAFCSYKKYNT